MDLGGLAAAGGSLLGGAAAGAVIQHVIQERVAKRVARDQSPDYQQLDFDGTWHAVWETSIQGTHNLDFEEIRITQRRNKLTLENAAISEDNPEGGFLYRNLVDETRFLYPRMPTAAHTTMEKSCPGVALYTEICIVRA